MTTLWARRRTARPSRSCGHFGSVYATTTRPADVCPTARRLRTNGGLSKDYLYGIFGRRATHRWEPFPLLPVTNHAPDVATMDALIEMVDVHDPHLVFTNLGDIDRFGHGDFTGQSVQAARRAALADTDGQVGRFVDHLHDTGRWKHSVLVVLADHSMDWSDPEAIVSLAPVLEADPLLAGNVVIAQNGGADLLYWTGAAGMRDEAVRRMRRLALRVDGVLEVHRPTALRLPPLAGDLVAFCQSGWRFSDPRPVSNPIPGNHGHPATEPIPFFIGGGHPAVPRGQTSSRPARPVDVAPTVGRLLGLGPPRGGYDGSSLL